MRSFCLFLGHGNRLTMAGWVSLVLSVSTPLALAIAGGMWMGTPHQFFAFPIYMFLVAGSSLIIWSTGSVLGRRAGVSLITRVSGELPGVGRISRKKQKGIGLEDF
jgi:hypothetical protein